MKTFESDDIIFQENNKDFPGLSDLFPSFSMFYHNWKIGQLFFQGFFLPRNALGTLEKHIVKHGGEKPDECLSNATTLQQCVCI